MILCSLGLEREKKAFVLTSHQSRVDVTGPQKPERLRLYSSRTGKLIAMRSRHFVDLQTRCGEDVVTRKRSPRRVFDPARRGSVEGRSLSHAGLSGRDGNGSKIRVAQC